MIPLAGFVVALLAVLTLPPALGQTGPEQLVSPAVAIAFALVSALALYLCEGNRRTRSDNAAGDLDSLTGVLSRGALIKSCARVFAERECTGKDVGVFYVDIDNFKEINDRYGHSFGDRYLRHVAGTIRSHIRKPDLVGRMGGDEFVVIQSEIDRDQMLATAERLIAAAGQPFSSAGTTVQGGISIGCRLSPAGEEPTVASDLADEAAYHAKSLGRGRYVEFSSALQKVRDRREQVLLALSASIHDGAFDLHYQPVFAVDGGAILGFEALLRLSTTDGGPLDPREVLAIAETSGLIVPLGARVLERATALATTWPENMHLAVNLSPTQFRAGNLPEVVRKALTTARLVPERLMLEVSERTLREGGHSVRNQLLELQDMGVQIALDDFGGDDATLGHLWAHHFDQIKIDGVLQDAYAFDPQRYRPLFDIILGAGRRLGLPVALTGIESPHGAALARELGCESYQGNWLGRPVPAERTGEFIARHLEKTSSPVDRKSAPACRAPSA